MVSIMATDKPGLRNEDSGFFIQLADEILFGVFDGCSTGERSDIISGYLCEALKLKFPYPFVADNVAEVLFEMYNDFLKHLSAEYGLNTMIIGYYNLDTKELIYIALGDGYIRYNDVEIIIDQDNHPDYPIYHLHSLTEFKEYVLKNFFIVQDVEKFCVATDGFILLKPEVKEKFFNNPFKNLKRLSNVLKKEGCYFPDDLTILSYGFNKD